MSDARTRLRSLDAFRGLTVAAMLLVNNPGTWSAIYAPLRHAAWHGWTPTDLIFPFFLFVVGVTTELAPKRPAMIVRRGLLIVVIGVLLNLFPTFDFATFRWSGVLQRIGIVYFVAALLSSRQVFESSRRHVPHQASLNPRYSVPNPQSRNDGHGAATPIPDSPRTLDDSTTRRLDDVRTGGSRALRLAGVVAALLLGYWFILAQGPYEPAEATVAARVDRALIPQEHLWAQSKTWDPEGPLSTIPAIATALLGVLAAPLVKAQKVKMLTGWGFAGFAAGWVWGFVFPINKSLWTSSYVLLTAGLAALLLAFFIVVVDRRALWKANAFVTFGINPIAAFVGSGLMAKTLGLVKIDGVSLQALSYRTLFKPYFAPQVASLLWGLAFVALWYAILRLMQWRGIVLKV